MNTQKGAIWATCSAISFLVSAIGLWLGLDIMVNTINEEFDPIIKGASSTDLFILATMFALLGIGFIVIYYLSEMKDTQETLRSACQSIEVGVYSLQEASQDSTASNKSK